MRLVGVQAAGTAQYIANKVFGAMGSDTLLEMLGHFVDSGLQYLGFKNTDKC